jgi:hypothetical protein
MKFRLKKNIVDEVKGLLEHLHQESVCDRPPFTGNLG